MIRKTAKSSSKEKEGSSSDSDSSTDTAVSKQKKNSTAAANGSPGKKSKKDVSSQSPAKPIDPKRDGNSEKPSKGADESKVKSKKTIVAVEEAVEVKVTKKRKTSESGAAVVTATTTIPDDIEEADDMTYGTAWNGKGKKQPRKSNAPFQRIKAKEVDFADERLKDNSFESKVYCICQITAPYLLYLITGTTYK